MSFFVVFISCFHFLGNETKKVQSSLPILLQITKMFRQSVIQIRNSLPFLRGSMEMHNHKTRNKTMVMITPIIRVDFTKSSVYDIHWYSLHFWIVIFITSFWMFFVHVSQKSKKGFVFFWTVWTLIWFFFTVFTMTFFMLSETFFSFERFPTVREIGF